MYRLGIRNLNLHSAVAMIGAAAMLAACSDGDSDTDGNRASRRGSQTSAELPRYVIATAVSTDETSTTYVKTVSELDGRELSLDDAREFGGWSDMKVLGGWVFVSGGEEPIVQRFAVTKEGELEPAGRIGFGDYSDYADLYMHVLISPTKAYFTTDKEYVIWNPETLEITGTIEFPELPVRDAIEPSFSLDRGTLLRDGKLYHLANWTDTKAYKMAPDSRVLVTDVASDEIVEVLEAPCPDLNVATSDDEGNIYFSNWVYSPAATLINQGAKACAVKLPAGSDSIDEDWIVTFADVNDGHEGANLMFAGGSRALFSVFREDKTPRDENTDVFDWLFGDTSWEFASLDLETHEVTPLPDLGEQSGGYYAYPHDDGLLLLAPLGDYSETAFLELDQDGNATEVLRAPGWSTRIYPLDRSELRD